MNQIKVLRNVVVNDKVLLHGSPKKLNEIHPHYTDNELAICATPYAELAIIMAILTACGPGNRGYTAVMTKEQCCLKIKVCDKVLRALLDDQVVGYVHPVDVDLFKRRSPFEYRSYESVYTLNNILVTKHHLPFIPSEGQTEYHVALNREVSYLFN